MILWLYVGGIVTWKLTPFLRAIREACSEQSVNGVRGKVSLKRIIPLIFTALICYMVVGCIHTGKPFNETAFWGILAFIGLATTVITVTQLYGIADKVVELKGKILSTTTEETNTNKVVNEIKRVEVAK